MPFLRRRGVMASESDIRRHTVFDATNKPSSSIRADPSIDLPATPAGSFSVGDAPGAPSPPATPTNGRAASTDAVMTGEVQVDRPESPPIQEETPKHRRFSMLRFRNASDSQLSARARQQAAAERPPPIPRPPAIITTAPTFELNAPPKKQSRIKLSSRLRRSGEEPRPQRDEPNAKEQSKKERRKTMLSRSTTNNSKQSVTFEEPDRPTPASMPPSYFDSHGSNGTALALPANRLSESSKSDGSSAEHRLYGSTTTTTRTVQTTTTFFRLPRRRQKVPEPLFPISHLPQKKSQLGTDASGSKTSLNAPPLESSTCASAASQPGTQEAPDPFRPSSENGVATPPTTSPAKALFGKTNASPATALFRPSSRHSGQSSPTRSHLRLRERSSTLSSLGRNSPRASVDEHLAPPTTRTSSSTGRRSFGDLLGLSRIRQNSEPSGRQGSLTPATPGSNTSKNNSLQIARDTVVLPERREDDTPAKYLARLEDVVSRSVIAAALSKGTDTFSQSVLRSYMRGFSFFGDPMDMAIRKLLMEAELPKETQQIDRCLQAFANRYHECNPGIYSTPDQAYFIAFSLLILHTDVFNKNNKHKMQKADYLKNTRGEGIFDEILDVFYDNITYTPFIHVEDDFDINGDRIVAHKTKKKSLLLPNNNQDVLKKASKEPIDPYALILDVKLDILRPNLKDVMHLDDHYSYLGTAKSLNLKELQKTFFRTGVLQIVSARSRPDAFMTEKTATNPDEAHPGIVDIKITKVGLLWRKEVKKRRTRSPWQEWGAILTGAQLYFFRNTAWVKNLMHQFESHVKQGHDGIPVIFKPPLEQFKPDALMSTDGAVALLDWEYKKHKYAFTYVRHGGFEEVLLADNEEEMNDWLAKLNYAAAFRTSGVRMRGAVGGSYDGQSRRAMRRLDSETVQNSAGEVVTIARSRIDHKMANDILTARRDIMFQKVSDANEKLEHAEKQLEVQLRNSRHLQILAPIQPKTRDTMLLSAARMAAQLKWTRMEIWRLRCHRDILLLDLEEERQLLGLPPAIMTDRPTATEKSGIHREESRTSHTAASQRSPRSPGHTTSIRTSTVTARSDEDSPLTDAFQTPPTSATAPSFHKKQNSWELPHPDFGARSLRKMSASSAVSSNSIMATPPRNIASSGSAPEKRPDSDEVDAGERDLLEQAGLIGAETLRSADGKNTKPTGDDGADRKDHLHKRHSKGGGATSERADRSKVRRSLHRTLRESAGHLSHHRSRRGKDATSATTSGAPALVEKAAGEPDVLTRGSGSFVVHGKKASVITFGNELQTLNPEERIRQRKAPPAQGRDQAASPDGSGAGSDSGRQAGGVGGDGAGDFRLVLDAGQEDRDRERRESAASASTATARSFQGLHRKYSAKTAAAAAGGNSLVVPSDDDSEAAVSFSEGRHSPLPPIEGDEEDEDEEVEEEAVDDDEDDEDDEDEDDEDQRDVVDEEDRLAAASRQAQFFTPEPPGTPTLEPMMEDEAGSVKDEERLPSPPLQAVSA